MPDSNRIQAKLPEGSKVLENPVGTAPGFIVKYKNSCVFIDEIDSGLYYKRLPSVWKTIIELARSQNVQLFVTTHSGEALEALGPLVRNSESDFRLITMKRKLGETTPVRVEAERNTKPATARQEPKEL